MGITRVAYNFYFVYVLVDAVSGWSDRCVGFMLAQVSLRVTMMPAAGGIVGVVLGGGIKYCVIDSGRGRVFSCIEKGFLLKGTARGGALCAVRCVSSLARRLLFA